MYFGVIMIDALSTMKAEVEALRIHVKYLESIINDLRQANQDLKYQLIEKASEE
jgi:hypothetical protein